MGISVGGGRARHRARAWLAVDLLGHVQFSLVTGGVRGLAMTPARRRDRGSRGRDAGGGGRAASKRVALRPAAAPLTWSSTISSSIRCGTCLLLSAQRHRFCVERERCGARELFEAQ